MVQLQDVQLFQPQIIIDISAKSLTEQIVKMPIWQKLLARLPKFALVEMPK